MASNTELGNLPLDGMRPILSFLDLTSLVKLFATFDRKIQRLLSAPGAFTYLRILPIVTVPRAPLRYFLMSVNNVSHLEFANGVKWAAPTLSLLKTLNPCYLHLSPGFLHESVHALLMDLQSSPNDEHLRSLAKNMTDSLLPDFAQLTPRLESLLLPTIGLIANTQRAFPLETLKTLSLPPSLTSLESDFFDVPIDLSSLPPTLRSLSLPPPQNLDFATLFRRFQVLQRLTLLQRITNDPIEVCSSPPLSTFESITLIEAIPKSLLFLIIEADVELICALLRHPNALRNSTIAELGLINILNANINPDIEDPSHPDHKTIDLAAALPLTLKAFSFLVPSIYVHRFTSAPTSLESLEFVVTSWAKTSLRNYYPHKFLMSATNLQSLTLSLDCLIGPSLASLEDANPTKGGKSVEENDDDDDEEEEEEESVAIHVDTQASLLPLNALPPSLKKLRLHRAGPLTLAGINALLSTLTSLSLPRMPLHLLAAFRMRLPDCKLRILKPILLLTSEDGLFLRQQFSEHFAPVLDPNAFAEALNRYCGIHKLKLSVKVEVPSDLDMSGRDGIKPNLETKTFFYRMRTLASGPVAFKPHELILSKFLKQLCPEATTFDANLDFQDNIFHSLRLPITMTRLDLHNSLAFFLPSNLPKTLTWISARSTCSMIAHGDMLHTVPWPCRLKVLDTPKWTWPGHSIGYLRDLEVFKAKFEQVADYNVVELLTNAVSRKTRLNMKIGIVYDVSGSLVPDDEVDGVKDIDWKKMCSITEKVLKRLMASPMPACKPDDIGYNADAEEIPDDTIGRVLSSLKPAHTYQIHTPICIPYSATSANLSVKREWILVSNLSRSPEDKNNHLKKQYPSRDALNFDEGDQRINLFNHPSMSVESCPLVRLTLGNCEISEHLFKALPASLRFLRLCHTLSSEFKMSDVPLPPQLQIFILETTTPACVFFAALPPSLRHLALLACPLNDSKNRFLGSGIPKLPNLKTILFGHVHEDVLHHLNDMVSRSPLARFEAQKIIYQPRRGPPDSELKGLALVEKTLPLLKIVSKVDVGPLLSEPISPEIYIAPAPPPKFGFGVAGLATKSAETLSPPITFTPPEDASSSQRPAAAPRKKPVRVPRR